MRCAMSRVRQHVPLAIALVVGLVAAPLAFAQADLQVTVVNQTCDPCTAGQQATIVNTVTNAGPDKAQFVLEVHPARHIEQTMRSMFAIGRVLDRLLGSQYLARRVARRGPSGQ